MSPQTTTTIALAAAGLLATGVTGAAVAAPSTPTLPGVTAQNERTPAKKVSAQSRKAREAAQRRALKTLPNGKRLPLNAYRVSSGWGHSSGPHAGREHAGQDFAAPTGARIFSATDGKVIMAKSYYGYGNLVIVRTPAGKTVLYAHQSRIQVKRGQTVRAGDVLGRVGSTGHSTGPHLHFEVRSAKDRAFNPVKFLGVSKAKLQQRANKLARLG